METPPAPALPVRTAVTNQSAYMPPANVFCESPQSQLEFAKPNEKHWLTCDPLLSAVHDVVLTRGVQHSCCPEPSHIRTGEGLERVLVSADVGIFHR